MQNLLDHIIKSLGTLKTEDVLALIVSVGIFIVGYVIQSRARRIQRLMAWNQYREPIKNFAEEVVDVLSRAEGLCEAKPEILGQAYWDSYNRVISEISALRDKGKFIFPNKYPNDFGVLKSAAYRGHRDATLSCLAAAFKLAVAINYKQSAHNKTKAQLDDPNTIELGAMNKPPPEREDEYAIAKQLVMIKEALDKLPDGYSEKGFNGKGWSCKSGLVEAKRQFVSKVFEEHLETRFWNEQITGIMRPR